MKKKINKTSFIVLMTIWSILTLVSLIDPLTMGLFFIKIADYCNYSNSILVAINTGIFGVCSALLYMKRNRNG
jgi:hypothetical protein